MSKFLCKKYAFLTPYVPGEQPRDKKYIKLNTNESPFPPSPKAVAAAESSAERLQLYPDPDATELTSAMAEYYGVDFDNVLLTNGSDEILNFAFMAFCDEDTPAVFPDISYGFYKVFAEINRLPSREVPLLDDFALNPADYFNADGTVFIANPNAPTGLALTLSQVESILKNNPDNVVVIDEAYVDFGGESAVKLLEKYDNLLVTQTFSKSRSLAGGRLGMGIASKGIIDDLKKIKYSTNPYNINSVTQSVGLGVMADPEYTRQNCRIIAENREYTARSLEELGFTVTDSLTNFVFAKSDKISGERLYLELRNRGILVRHFTSEKLREFNRITIGTAEQMKKLIQTVKEILEEK